MDKRQTATSCGNTEVRNEAYDRLARSLRERASAAPEVAYQRRWGNIPRRVYVLGYPKFDVYAEWLMDFASISAAHLGRADWQNFRRSILVPVPDCSDYCWYCFNDAWPALSDGLEDSSDGNNVASEPAGKTATEIVAAFKVYRDQCLDKPDMEANVLRLTGGEPFAQPELVRDLAVSFERTFEDSPDSPILWVDTNLVPFVAVTTNDSARQRYAEAIAALKALEKRAAVHVCFHGTTDPSLGRSTRTACSLAELADALRSLVNAGLEVYPRINPAGLTPEATVALFNVLLNIGSEQAQVPSRNLPARTCFGPISFYQASVDPPSLFSEGDPAPGCDGRRPTSGTVPPAAESVPRNPAAAVIHSWNMLMKRHYGVGYGVVPRHICSELKRVDPARARPAVWREPRWESFVLLVRGWDKEVCAAKLLELLGLPKGAELDLEYDNNWLDPSFVRYSYAANVKHSMRRVLCVAAPKASEPATIIPLRWADVVMVTASDDGLERRCGTQIRLRMGDYAVDFEKRFLDADDKVAVAEKLGRFIGATNLPLATHGYFCQYMGAELATEKPPSDEKAFKSVVLDLATAHYSKTQRVIYYRICRIEHLGKQDGTRRSRAVEFTNGRAKVYQGDTMRITLETYDPMLGGDNRTGGCPGFDDTEIFVASTHPEVVATAPNRVRLSRVGETEVCVYFPRQREFSGMLLFRPMSRRARIAELTIPFKVSMRREARR